MNLTIQAYITGVVLGIALGAATTFAICTTGRRASELKNRKSLFDAITKAGLTEKQAVETVQHLFKQQ